MPTEARRATVDVVNWAAERALLRMRESALLL
jgi:hypothetical protein